jgi:hypothetical protein
MKKLSAYVGGHVFAEWWVEPDYVASALAVVGGVAGFVVVVERCVCIYPASSSAYWYGGVVALNWFSLLETFEHNQPQMKKSLSFLQEACLPTIP